VGIAVQLGWIDDEFRHDGLKLASVRDSVDPRVRESHFDHKLANSFRQGGSVPAIWARATGRDTRLIGLTWTDEAQVILARADSNIHSIKDLKGRRLGIATRPNDIIDFWKATTLRAYIVALGLEGLTEKDVELVEIPRQETSFDGPRALTGQGPSAHQLLEVKALKEGRVDAIFHKGSRGLEVADAIGARVVFDVWNHPNSRARANNHAPRTFTVDSALLDNHPDVVTRVVSRVLQAGQWAEEHPAEAVAYVARETASSEHWVRAAYGPDVHKHLKTDLEASSIAALEDFTEFLARYGFLPQRFDVRGWIDPRPLAVARTLLAQPALPETLSASA
ncbi:MAG: ABC transporter substrate-binding protein, partial [Polyangiaceae bacterium]|nr:ABC transporter substrate-binding protein [Polyangiaceae bacterium]